MSLSRPIPHLRRRRFPWLLILLCILLPGCVKNEFRISLSIPKSVSTVSFLYYASDPSKGWLAEDVAHIRDGKGELLGRTRNPSLVWVFTGASGPGACFYVSRGDRIEISGSEADPISWDIRGNGITADLSAWRLANLKPLQARDAAAINGAVAAQVGKAPSAPATAIILLVYYDRGADPAGFERLYKKLEGDAADPSWLSLVARCDILEGAPSAVKAPRQVVLNTYPLGCDTISISSSPTLLLFLRSDARDHKQHVADIRSLLADYPDSAARVIARISVDPDSLTHIRALRSDSLRGAIHAWMPLGIADPQARALGVASIPAAVVISKGKAVYSGSDITKALGEFRRIAPAKKPANQNKEVKP